MTQTYYGEFLLNKVLEENNINALKKQSITERDFVTNAEKDVFNFISNYSATNGGNCPDYRTVVARYPSFNIRESVQDSYEYLAKQLKAYNTQMAVQKFMMEKANDQFKEMNGFDWIDYVVENLNDIKLSNNFRHSVGTDLALDSQTYLEEYRNRKEGKSFKIWKSAFPSNVDYLSGNMYTWYGRSGRGKSVFNMVEVLEAALQGACVLIWSLEMSTYEWLSRAYAYLSARAKVMKNYSNGDHAFQGFDTNQMLKGSMEIEDEELFESFLHNINTFLNGGRIIIRATDDISFDKRSVKELEADILHVKPDVVMVDPIYLMDFEQNTSRVAGGDVANTSKKLKRLSGTYQCVLHVITQAEEVSDDTDEDGHRELRVPTRKEIMKTKAVLQDATNTFGIDTCDGMFRIELGKGRNGGEGTVIEGIYLPAVGVVYEPSQTILAKEIADLGF